jgi:light-regulated signal transduction histidine kinase (bacteriophytochrome)
MEYRLIHKNKSVRWVYDKGTVFNNVNGNPISSTYCDGCILDITDKKNMELKLKSINLNLEKKIKKRTKQLELANEELETFSYSVSHELRAPLRAINGFNKAVIDDYSDNLDKTGRDYLNRVHKATQKLSDLIDHFLKLAKVSRANLKREWVDISKLAEEVTKMLHTIEPQRNVTIKIKSDIQIFADRNLMRIVIQNLLENAWKYTSKKSQSIIEVGCMPENDIHIYYVKDNGAGFDMEFYEKLFYPFKTLHIQKEFSGSGIGLATVKRIIDRHSGKIWAESEIEEGAIFYFTIQ